MQIEIGESRFEGLGRHGPMLAQVVPISASRGEAAVLDLMNKSQRRIEGHLRPTVLIVDREPLYRWFVSETLDACDLHVVQFGSMADAVGYFARHGASDLLLVDSQTVADEGPRGLAALGHRARLVPCVILGHAEPEGTVLDLDGLTVVEKPIDVDALVVLVQSRLHPGPSSGFVHA